jgi:hypothetical protein
MAYITCLIWNIFVVGGTAYLIVMHEWSAWWLVAAYFGIFWPQPNKKDKNNDKNEKENDQTISY